MAREPSIACIGTAWAALTLTAAPLSVTWSADADVAELSAHRALWDGAGIDDYEYGYNKFCECHRDHPPETLVTISDGAVVRVRHRPFGSDHEVEAEQRNLEWYWTVDGLFDLIATALERQVVVRADYDAELGYPTNVYVDYDPNLIGEELDVRLTRLDRLTDD